MVTSHMGTCPLSVGPGQTLLQTSSQRLGLAGAVQGPGAGGSRGRSWCYLEKAIEWGLRLRGKARLQRREKRRREKEWVGRREARGRLPDDSLPWACQSLQWLQETPGAQHTPSS